MKFLKRFPLSSPPAVAKRRGRDPRLLSTSEGECSSHVDIGLDDVVRDAPDALGVEVVDVGVPGVHPLGAVGCATQPTHTLAIEDNRRGLSAYRLAGLHMRAGEVMLYGLTHLHGSAGPVLLLSGLLQ